MYLLLNQMDGSEKEPKPETKEPAAATSAASTEAKADTSGTNPSKKPGGELAGENDLNRTSLLRS